MSVKHKMTEIPAWKKRLEELEKTIVDTNRQLMDVSEWKDRLEGLKKILADTDRQLADVELLVAFLKGNRENTFKKIQMTCPECGSLARWSESPWGKDWSCLKCRWKKHEDW